jgi:hypothetical protein
VFSGVEQIFFMSWAADNDTTKEGEKILRVGMNASLVVRMKDLPE